MKIRPFAISVLFIILFTSASFSSEFDRPWLDPSPALVLDAYGPNRLDLSEIKSDQRVVGILHKATQGTSFKDAKYTWRREAAKSADFLWGSYHLLTTEDIQTQVNVYLETVGIHADEVYSLDVECLAGPSGCANTKFKVTIEQVMSALLYFKSKTGHFPLIYANGSVTDRLAQELSSDPKFIDVRLWYARFKGDISRHFPDSQWPSYTLWQFSSEINCKPAPKACPYRVKGTSFDMDINVFPGDPATLRAAWPIDRK
jgi:GH25 family lysozyme M1 (1,4-beta-N-acetylmuramidase)